MRGGAGRGQGLLLPDSEQSWQWLDLSQVALSMSSAHTSRVFFSLTFILKNLLSMPCFLLYQRRVQNKNILSIHSVLISTAETLNPVVPDPFIDEETHKAIKATDVFESLILCLPGFVIPIASELPVKGPTPN